MSDSLRECKGCGEYKWEWDLSSEGYCKSCQYQHEQNLDNKTGECLE